MRSLLPALACLVIPLLTPVCAEAVKDREGAVRQDRAARENDPRWIYNDLDRAFTEARRTGKPLLAVLRCVPCLACAGIDAQVLLENTGITPLLDQFVCVRIINANALDLTRFQFDFDLSFTALAFNGDGTLYGRYGSWSHQKNSQDTATAGFRRALEEAVKLHQGYPANRASLAGKQGAPTAYRTPVDIPGLEGKYSHELDWNGKVVPSCVHCHQIGDGLRLTLRNERRPIPADLIYPMPPAETIGLILASHQVARVDGVLPGSAAARAGFQAGDELVSLGGQPLISVADVSWALHRHPESGPLAATVRRNGSEQERVLDLAPGWRWRSDISGRVGTWGLRGMATGGLLLEDLPEAERARRGLGPAALALRVKHAGEYGKHAAAKKAGFRKEDVLVKIDGETGRLTESELIGRLLQKHPPGTQVPVTVQRGAETVELRLPIQ